MGSSNSQPIPKISSDFIRQNRAIFGNKKKDYRDLLQKDQQVQQLYLKDYKPADRISSMANSSFQDNGETPGEITYDEAFFRRFDDVETVKRILFTIEDTAEKIHERIDLDEGKAKPNSFPIKLYIAEPSQEIKEVSSDLDAKVKFAVNAKLVGLFGLAHAAVQIGDKMVHFLDNHFVKIDIFKASQALLLINMSESGRLPRSEEVLNTICEVIVDWNKHAFYDKALRNCQDFVEDLCTQINSKCNLKSNDRLGLSFEQNKILRNYLDTLVKNPKDSGFNFTLDGETQIFETHAELDEWEEQNKSKLIPDQLAFLKGFHRAFQLRYAAAEVSNNFSLSKRYEPSPYSGCTRGNATLI